MPSKCLSVFLFCVFSLGHTSSADDFGIANRCADLLVGIKPKLGFASSKHDNFDVRIVGRWGARSRWKNRELQEAAITQVTTLRAALRHLNFSSDHFLQVLVERHSGAVRSPVYGEIGTSLSVGAMALITTPNIFGGRSLFFGKMNRDETPETMPRTLLLKALNEDYNSVFSSFSIAHELAHDTEVSNSPRSLIWIEARADFLAYVVTGESQIAWPGKIGALAFDESGKMFVTDLPTKRSLSRPRVKRIKNLLPNVSAYHENSELISGFLYRLGGRFGLEVPLAFIKWMDQQAPIEKLDLETYLVGDKKAEYGPAVSRAWGEVVNSFFDLFVKWLSLQPNGEIRAAALVDIENLRR